ncbi:hypothetical protein JB92DRAFT_607221 [Gautieria morchelliformis]|nr:hypothetical protein JB92DRAFT_607221 [Gautieria morchelliformis]
MTSPPVHTLTLNHVQWTRYVQVASLTLVLHDHVLTFQKEVDLVWRGASPRSWPRLIFLSARYACPLALVVNTIALLDPNTSKNVSRGWLLFHGWSGFVFFAGVQVISQMRLWAMYRSMRTLIIMTIIVLLALVAMGVVEGLGFTHVQVTSEPVRNLVHICGPGHLPRYVFAFWIPPLLVEIVSVVLVITKAVLYFQSGAPRKSAGSRLMSSILRYSLFYFVVTLVVYIADLYVWTRLPVNAFELFIPLTYALPSVAGNRMLLSLRSVFYADHLVLPVQDDAIGLTVVDPDRGLTVEEHNPLKEFESFFGENRH